MSCPGSPEVDKEVPVDSVEVRTQDQRESQTSRGDTTASVTERQHHCPSQALLTPALFTETPWLSIPSLPWTHLGLQPGWAYGPYFRTAQASKHWDTEQGFSASAPWGKLILCGGNTLCAIGRSAEPFPFPYPPGASSSLPATSGFATGLQGAKLPLAEDP